MIFYQNRIISGQKLATVLPAKSDIDVVFCLQLLSNINLYTPLELMRIGRSLVY